MLNLAKSVCVCVCVTSIGFQGLGTFPTAHPGSPARSQTEAEQPHLQWPHMGHLYFRHWLKPIHEGTFEKLMENKVKEYVYFDVTIMVF